MHPQASKNTSACYMNAVQREMKINELKETVKELKENLFQVRREIGELRETFAISYFESDQAKNDSFAVMVRFVLEHFEDVRKGMLNGIDDSKVNFVFDQFKIARRRHEDYVNKTGPKKVHGIRWSIATREFADEIYSRGSGAYKTAHKSDALVLPSLSGVKARMLKYRHTDMTSVDWCDELRYELVFRYGSMEKQDGIYLMWLWMKWVWVTMCIATPPISHWKY
eukprot:316741_1